MNIVLYISHHGFGHATRMNALAGELKKCGIFCHIRSGKPEFLFQALDDQFYELTPVTIDDGLKHRNWWMIDLEATRKAIQDRYGDYRELVEGEVRFIRENEIEMVVGDIPPLAFEIASQADVFSIAISNFDWYYNYLPFFKGDAEIMPILEKISSMYHKVDYAIKLPFSDEDSMAQFPVMDEAGLLTREMHPDRAAFCEKNGIDPGSLLIRVSFGGEGGNPIDMAVLSGVEGITIIAKGSPENDYGCVRHFNTHEAFTDAMSACDICITKLGYSTLAELTQLGKFVIYTYTSVLPENVVLERGLDEYSRKMYIPLDEIGHADWQEIIEDIRGQLDKPYNEEKYRNRNREVGKMCIRKRFESTEGKVAIIDVGTNNIQMLWAIHSMDGIRVVHRASRISALGKGMKDGRLTSAGIQRAKDILADYADYAQAFSDRVIITGTSCSREASNIAELSDWIREKYGIEYRILSEEEEALNTAEVMREDFPEYERIVSFDIGGGSTEFNLLVDGELQRSISLPVGIRRLETLFGNDYGRQREYILHQLERIRGWKAQDVHLTGIGGSIANLAAIKAGLKRYRPEIVHKMTLESADLKNFIDIFGNLTYKEIQTLMPFEPARADLIRSGSVFIKMVMDFFEQDTAVVSDRGLMFGVLYRLIKES